MVRIDFVHLDTARRMTRPDTLLAGHLMKTSGAFTLRGTYFSWASRWPNTTESHFSNAVKSNHLPRKVSVLFRLANKNSNPPSPSILSLNSSEEISCSAMNASITPASRNKSYLPKRSRCDAHPKTLPESRH